MNKHKYSIITFLLIVSVFLASCSTRSITGSAVGIVSEGKDCVEQCVDSCSNNQTCLRDCLESCRTDDISGKNGLTSSFGVSSP